MEGGRNYVAALRHTRFAPKQLPDAIDHLHGDDRLKDEHPAKRQRKPSALMARSPHRGLTCGQLQHGGRIPVLLIALLLASGWLAACRGSASTPVSTPTMISQPTNTPAPTATSASPTATPFTTTLTASPLGSGSVTNGPLPTKLAGTFAVTIDLAEVTHADEAGDWFLTLTADAGYQFGRLSSGSVENYGDLTIDGERLTFSNEKGAGACVGPGVYTWQTSGDRLALTLVQDTCSVRVVQNSAHTYVRCPSGIVSCRYALDHSTP